MIKKFLWVGGFFAMAAIIGILYVFNKPHAAVGRPDFTVSAKELINEFEQDENAANKKYLDKVIEVTGTLTDVVKKEDSFVLLLGDTTSFSNVNCTLDVQHDSIAYGVQPGDQVTVKGICTGRLLDVVLVDCNIVHND